MALQSKARGYWPELSGLNPIEVPCFLDGLWVIASRNDQCAKDRASGSICTYTMQCRASPTLYSFFFSQLFDLCDDSP